MKRFFTLAALLISIVSFAAAPPRAGKIIINNADNDLIQVRINGKTYNVNQQTMVLNNLYGGKHHIEIYKTERKQNGRIRNKAHLIYSSAVYVDPSFILDININRMGRVTLQKSIPVRYDNDRHAGMNKGRNSQYDENDYKANRPVRSGW
jgi:hypothetical protein